MWLACIYCNRQTGDWTSILPILYFLKESVLFKHFLVIFFNFPRLSFQINPVDLWKLFTCQVCTQSFMVLFFAESKATLFFFSWCMSPPQCRKCPQKVHSIYSINLKLSASIWLELLGSLRIFFYVLISSALRQTRLKFSHVTRIFLMGYNSTHASVVLCHIVQVQFSTREGASSQLYIVYIKPKYSCYFCTIERYN